MNNGGRNMMNSLGGGQPVGGNPGYQRNSRHPGSPNMMQQQQQMPGNYSPQSLYGQPMGEHYHTMGGHMPREMDTFPTTPYTPAAQLFMAPSVRNAFSTPMSLHVPREVTSVTSKKFASYGTVYNLEKMPAPTVLDASNKTHTQAYQTSDRTSGKDIFLRRFVNVQFTKPVPPDYFDALINTRHPNLVSLKRVIPTEDFVMGSKDIIMEYRYINGAKSLKEAFIDKNIGAPEAILWSFTCQMLGLLRSFHEMGMYLRSVNLSKILFVEATGRFYFTGLGVQDLLDLTGRGSAQPLTPEQQKQQDVCAFGFILFQLATASDKNTADPHAEHRTPGYTTNCTELIRCFMAGLPYEKLCSALGERLSMEVAHHEGYADYLLEECSRERHNGRLMRLMMKLNFVLESPMVTGVPEFYPLRLFSQYLFNQMDDHSRVHVDWGHAYHCLNKLDCSANENIQLMENDGRSLFVISFADLHSMLENAFSVLKSAASRTDIDGSSFGMAGSPGSL